MDAATEAAAGWACSEPRVSGFDFPHVRPQNPARRGIDVALECLVPSMRVFLHRHFRDEFSAGRHAGFLDPLWGSFSLPNAQEPRHGSPVLPSPVPCAARPYRKMAFLAPSFQSDFVSKYQFADKRRPGIGPAER